MEFHGTWKISYLKKIIFLNIVFHIWLMIRCCLAKISQKRYILHWFQYRNSYFEHPSVSEKMAQGQRKWRAVIIVRMEWNLPPIAWLFTKYIRVKVMHWGCCAFADILQTTFSIAFPWSKPFALQIKYDWNVFLNSIISNVWALVHIMEWCPKAAFLYFVLPKNHWPNDGLVYGHMRTSLNLDVVNMLAARSSLLWIYVCITLTCLHWTTLTNTFIVCNRQGLNANFCNTIQSFLDLKLICFQCPWWPRPIR